MEKCSVSTEEYVYIGLTIYCALCCTIGLLYGCVIDRTVRAKPQVV